jgi:alkylation response protein AidB-like acyl-CoA dehydrogenase
MSINLAPAESQVQVQQAAHELFARHSPLSVVRELEARTNGSRGYQPDLWSQMAERGWMDLGFLDLYALYEEMGRFLIPSPHLDTVAVTADLLTRLGQRGDVLGSIRDGTCIVSLALLEGTGVFGPAGIELTATPRGDDFVLTGTKLLVSFVPSANYLLSLARTSDGLTVFLVDAGGPGISSAPMQNIAGAPLYEVVFDEAVVSASSVVGGVDQGWAALSPSLTKAAVLQTASIVGAAQAVLEMTNQYAKDREQFGRPIGSYQAVQYLITDILIDMYSTDLLGKQAAYRVDAGVPFEREAAMAIAHGKRAAAHLHRQAHEVHAGVGFMVDHDLNLFSRRSKFWENNLGDARFHEERLADHLCR